MREKLLVLHGAAGSKSRLDNLIKRLDRQYDVLRMNFSGHGGEPIPTTPFSIDMFVKNVIDFLNHHQVVSIKIFGYSMGGFVALKLAAENPERVSKIFTLGTKLNWNKEVVKQNVKRLDPKVIEEKLPEYAAELEEIHKPNDWKKVLAKTVEMMENMGKRNPLTDDDLADLEIPVLIGMGDRDNMVIIEESLFAYRLLKKGQLLILPDTPHPIHNVNQEVLAREVLRFMKD